MVDQSLKRLKYLCDIIPPLLENISEKEFHEKPDPAKWSKKQILGHLIDSATNNHQRFVRCQFEERPFITYNQDKWNEASYYQQMESRHLIRFWQAYNHHLLKLITLIPNENLHRTCQTAVGNEVTLEFLITDYVVHLEYHLRQLTDY